MSISAKGADRIDFRDNLAYIGVIEAMMSMAGDLCVHNGVAVILVEETRPKGISRLHYRAVNGIIYGRDGNHFGSAMAMIGTMKGVHTSTGNYIDHLLKWETPKKGGLLHNVDGYSIYVAFSGDCTEDQNLEVAKLGMAMLFSDGAKS